MPKVSVIIPVYGAERWIERCARSLFEQTLDSIEYIFVDDCSPDLSIAVLQRVLADYPNRQPQVQILRHENNQGVAAARTTGMKAATGLYMIHCDPDDWVEPQAYQLMFEKAQASNADIVVSDYYREEGVNCKIVQNNLFSNSPRECIKNLHTCYFFPSLCCTLVRHQIVALNSIYPFKGINTGEDLNVILRMFYFSSKVEKLSIPIYHYIQNSESLTQKTDLHLIWNNNIKNNISQIEYFFASTNDHSYHTLINYLKFTKKQILLSANPAELILWFKTYPECAQDIFKFKSLPFSRRVMYSIFSHCYPALWLWHKVKH